MKNCLKFGVICNQNTTLVTVDSSASLSEIIEYTGKHFSIPPEDLQNYCFLLYDKAGKAETYLSDENRALLDKDVVHLVQIPSLAAQSAILRIESELKVTTWDESKCRNLQFYLAELANLLPCAQFACEFIKDSGHEVVFHLVEVFHQFPDSHQSTIQNQSNPFVPDASVWTTLMACLAELSKYSINGSDEQDEGDEEATDYSMTLSTDGFFNTEDGRLSRPIFGATSNELFSWHLASEKFLSALIQRSWGETDLEAMRNELKVLYNILSNCPSRSETVISQTGAEFIFDLLKKAHGLSFTHRPSPIHAYGGCSLGPPCACNTPPVSPVATGESPGVTDTVAAYGTHSSDLGSPVEWWTDPLRNEVLILLLDFMYLILYRARRAGKLSTVLSRYLNCTTLRQIFSYFPQLRSHNFRDNSTTNSHYLGGMDIKKGGTLKRQSEYSNPNSSDSQTSVGRRESGGVFISLEHATHSPNTPLSGSSSRRSLSPSNVLVKLDPKELEILLALYRIQRIQLAFLADEMSTPLDRDSPSEIEKMQRLCSLAFPNVHTSLTEEQIQNAYGQLGFDVPDDPFANFEASPGRLGFRCLCAFSKKCENLMKEMLSYGRAYHRSPLAFNSFFTSYFPSSSPSKCGAKLRPSRSSVTSREAGADEPFTPLIEVTDRRSHHRRVRRRTLDSVNFASSLDDDESDQCNPLFPLASAAKALTQMLCELLGVDGTLEPLNSRGSRSHDPFVPPIYPMLFQPRTMEFSPFEELFISVFSVLFYSWTQFNAAPDDLNRVLRIVREQVIQALSRNPLSPDEFEQNLTKCTPQTVRAVWKERDDINRDRMQQSHPALTELNKDLTLAHELHVREQRMNMLAKFAPLDYTPPKLKGTQKLQVVLSPDRKSLIVRDQQQCTQAIWHLVCISRVSSGVEEKVKKNPERTIVLHVKVCDTSDQGEDWNSGSQQQSGKWRTIQPQLVARSILEYNYWLDGLFILLKNSNPSKQFVQDVQRLVDLDMKIRLASLDLTKLPRRPAPIPPDPPELDFEDS
ncbi:unnamed protein product [Calicophoron daubneyi]|uniref:ELMO domain-containing protein n=1 Tax=Calicophoron daubneyi TaxID=300641 RepID=A0AAV2TCT9_CALDB